MRKVRITTILELTEPLEKCNYITDRPYQIERTEENGQIIWYGIDTNWKFKDNQWYKLENAHFVPCVIPEYEKLYLELDKKKSRREKIEKIENEIR